MHVGGCLLLVTTLVWSFSFVFADGASGTRKKRHLFPLMGFLQGYKMGQNFALQLPPLVLSPVVVLPVNQQQTVHIQGNPNENFNENGSFQIITPEKLIQHCNSTDNSKDKSYNNVTIKNNVELFNNDAKEEDTFRQNIVNDTVTEPNVGKDSDNMTTTEATTISEGETTNVTNTTKPNGPYPNAIYKNDMIASLSITEPPINSIFMIPSTDNNWQNFSSNLLTTELQVESRAGEVWTNNINYSKRDFTRDTYYYYNDRKPSTDSYYRRPVNHLNQERWSTTYFGDNKPTSEFRPLAGLYYDGFLHKSPAKKTGFVPYGNTFYY
ncbi:uncharacterized protein LOC123709504 [Pieris brassicae]|uniref:Uncharacterized protein n=1 Tax=Pieris brassicae TaxID=7116 RepID=A0A9P0XBB9_PIEBR|nr:uncharacterized protein LOC123709504 [Pieris brassicae]CAH4028506.1 unnamed protein product [Pieris brassicae]